MKLLVRDELVSFWCPGCRRAHDINTGSDVRPFWTWNGSVEQSTFTPSVHVKTGHYCDGQPQPPNCHLCTRAAERGVQSFCSVCHSYVRDGRIQFLADSTHALAGQTVDLPDWPKGE